MDLRTCEAKSIAYIRLTGPLNREIILEAFDAAVMDKRYRKGMGRLWDFRDANLSSLDSFQVEEIAKQKMVDLNANDLDAACKIIAGTARSMGIEVG